MGRRNNSDDRFYCPKCGKKELQRVYELTNPSGVPSHRLTWVCDYNAPNAQSWRRVGYKNSAGPPCGVVIKHSDRDAKISDYHNLLDLMIRPGALIKHHLLETRPDVRKRGLEVLFSSELLDLVRLNDRDGIAAYIIFKATWEDGSTKHPDQVALCSRAAKHIEFRGVPLQDICLTGSRGFRLWTPKGSTALFKGRMGVPMRTALIEWAKGLDEEFEQLRLYAITEHKRWEEERKAVLAQIGSWKATSSQPHVQLDNYCGNRRRATISVQGWVTPAQAKAIADILHNAATGGGPSG